MCAAGITLFCSAARTIVKRAGVVVGHRLTFSTFPVKLNNQRTTSPSTVFLGHPREIMATFLSGFGVPLATREAVAGPTSEAVADVERAAATPRVGFCGNALGASGPPRCATTRVAWGSCMPIQGRMGQLAWR